MENLHALILGALQGVTEIWPISSTAHLAIFPWFFGWKDPGLAFDVALHVGTFVAILAYFWQDWYKFFADSSMRKYLWYILLATIPGLLAGYFLGGLEDTLRTPLVIAGMLVIFGIILYLADQYGKATDEIEHVTWSKSLIMGVAQAIAIIPGVSRSGVTMTAGMFLGLSREAAAKFSFLLAAPIILGAAAKEGLDVAQHGLNGGTPSQFIIGFLASLVVGYFAIRYLLRFLQRRNFVPFVWYRIILAGIIVLLYFLRR